MYRYVMNEIDFALKLENGFGYKTMVFNVAVILAMLTYNIVRIEILA